MDLKKVVPGLKKKLVNPEVYSLLLKSSEVRFIALEVAYSMEEAAMKAINSFKARNPGIIKQGELPTIELNNQSSFEELLKGYFEHTKEKGEFSYFDEDKHKSNLMKQIIDFGDRNLFEDNRSVFSLEERQFIKDKLEKKK